MAEKIIRYLLDDYEDNKEVEADAGTVTFAFDGVAYEMDLSQKNKNKLRDQLGPWMAKARRAGGRRTTTKSSVAKPKMAGTPPDQLQAMREWGRRNGFTVSDKGRVPREIQIAFEEAQKVKPEPIAAV